jgi:hypothetical protein
VPPHPCCFSSPSSLSTTTTSSKREVDLWTFSG